MALIKLNSWMAGYENNRAQYLPKSFPAIQLDCRVINFLAEGI